MLTRCHGFTILAIFALRVFEGRLNVQDGEDEAARGEAAAYWAAHSVRAWPGVCGACPKRVNSAHGVVVVAHRQWSFDNNSLCLLLGDSELSGDVAGVFDQSLGSMSLMVLLRRTVVFSVP